MLWTDATPITQADLEGTDPEVAPVATAEGLSLAPDGAVLRNAMEECGHQILSRLQTFSGYIAGLGIGGAHLAAVMNTGGSPVSRPYIRLTNIVVTSPYPNVASPVQAWLRSTALRTFYRAATNKKLQDRYEQKMEMWDQRAADDWRLMQSLGLPIVLEPFPAPAAVYEAASGAWTSSNVTSVTQSGTAAAVYRVAVTFVDSSRYVSQTDKGNAESGPSEIVQIDVPINKAVKVDITTVTPVTVASQARGTADGIYALLAVTGWNVWIGAATGPLYLQNSAPIAIATKTYTLTADPVLTGSQLGSGQVPDHNCAFGGGVISRA